MFPRIFPRYVYIVVAVAILSFLAATACRRVPVNSLSFDDVVYVDDSDPAVWTLADGDTLSIPVLGVRAFAIADSMLVVSTNDNSGYVTVLDPGSLNVLGRFIKSGRGPGEVLSFPGVAGISFEVHDSCLRAFWGSSTGVVYVWNVSESLEKGESVVDGIDIDLGEYPYLLATLPLSDGDFLFAAAGEDGNTITRFVLTADGERVVTAELARLNSVVSSGGTSSGQVVGGKQVTFNVPGFNHINGSYAYDTVRHLIVEAERVRNSINIFSIDGKYARTVCTIGKRIDDVSEISGPLSGDNYTLRPKAYPDFFTVFHWFGRSTGKFIRLYDYGGEPIAEIPLPDDVFIYDFDMDGGYLYTLAPDTESLVRYDVAELLGTVRSPASEL